LGRTAEEIAVHAVGVERKIQRFADFEKDVAAGEASFGILGKFGIDMVFDDLPAGGDFAFLARQIDAFAEVAQDEGAPWVFRLMWGFDVLGLGFGFAGRAWCRGEDAGGEAGFQNDGFAYGAGEAEEDEAGIGAPGARRFGRLILLRLLYGEAGELHAEFGEFLEHVQVAGAEFGNLGGGFGENGVQGFASKTVVSEVKHVVAELASFLLRSR
jgi:hypothetical protein